MIMLPVAAVPSNSLQDASHGTLRGDTTSLG